MDSMSTASNFKGAARLGLPRHRMAFRPLEVHGRRRAIGLLTTPGDTAAFAAVAAAAGLHRKRRASDGAGALAPKQGQSRNGDGSRSRIPTVFGFLSQNGYGVGPPFFLGGQYMHVRDMV